MVNDQKHTARQDRQTVLLFTAAAAILAALLTLAAARPACAADPKQVADSLSYHFEQTDNAPINLPALPTLDDYLVIAQRQNPELRSAFYRWRAELAKTGYAGSLPDPMLTYGYFVENVETRVGPQEHRLGLRQTIPWFGELSAGKAVASASSRAAYQKFEAQRLRVVYETAKTYCDFWYLGREIQLTKDNLELLKFWESVVRSKYKVALKTHPDVIKAQVELGKLDNRLASLEDRLWSIRADFRAELNLPDTISLPVPTRMPDISERIDNSLVTQAAIEANPNLKALSNIIEKERASARLAGAAWAPDLTLGVDYIATGDAINPALDESGKDPWMVSVGINLPIWFGKNNAKKSEAEARERAAEYSLHDSRNRLVAYVEKVAFEFEDALRRNKLFRDGLVPKAKQSLEASYTAYQAGELDFLNVLDAQRQLLDFQLEQDRATSQAAAKFAELEMIIGKKIDNSMLEN